MLRYDGVAILAQRRIVRATLSFWQGEIGVDGGHPCSCLSTDSFELALDSSPSPASKAAARLLATTIDSVVRASGDSLGSYERPNECSRKGADRRILPPRGTRAGLRPQDADARKHAAKSFEVMHIARVDDVAARRRRGDDDCVDCTRRRIRRAGFGEERQVDPLIASDNAIAGHFTPSCGDPA